MKSYNLIYCVFESDILIKIINMKTVKNAVQPIPSMKKIPPKSKPPVFRA
jgi:hypothetical protein